MLQLSLNVTEKSSFLRSRRMVRIEADLTGSEEIPVSEFLEELFTIAPDFIPNEAFRASEETPLRLENLRGRPIDAFAQDEQKELSDLRQKQQEELFYTRGAILEPEDEELSLDDTATPAEYAESPFSFRVTTRFESFKQTSNIVYRVFHSPSPVFEEIRPYLSGRMLARLLPFRLDTIRLGLESYQTRTFGSLFGSVPSVRDRLYLEISRDRIRLTASGDYSRKDDSLPFSKENLLAHLDAALSRCGMFPNLFQEICAKLA